MGSRQDFLNTILTEYHRIGNKNVPEKILAEVSEILTDYYYDQYTRFRKQYPKSIKRYSSFQIKDLNHPTTHELIIKTLKSKVGEDYKMYAIVLLNKSLDELKEFEKNREEFYKMF